MRPLAWGIPLAMLALGLLGFLAFEQRPGATVPPPQAPGASGQPGGPGSPGGPGGQFDREFPPSPVMQALDADGNGELSAAEIAGAAAALKPLDGDGDGTLSRAELTAFAGAQRADGAGGESEGHPAPPEGAQP